MTAILRLCCPIYAFKANPATPKDTIHIETEQFIISNIQSDTKSRDVFYHKPVVAIKTEYVTAEPLITSHLDGGGKNGRGNVGKSLHTNEDDCLKRFILRRFPCRSHLKKHAVVVGTDFSLFAGVRFRDPLGKTKNPPTIGRPPKKKF
jgi:hypothetical protein